jgi:hypothetical protein
MAVRFDSVRRQSHGGIHKVRPQIAPGPFALARYIRCAKECQLLAAAFRSSQVIGAGTHVALTRGCHRAAFGTATRARPCRHPFFMLCFLAGCSAGTDGSLTGRAGRGLGLSRRNERRAEQRRNDEGKDCKFGSHKKVSPKDYWMRRPIGRALRKSYGRTVADVWKVTERRTSKAAFERNSYSGVAQHEQGVPRHHHHGHRHPHRGAIRICSLHTTGRLIRLRVRQSPQ